MIKKEILLKLLIIIGCNLFINCSNDDDKNIDPIIDSLNIQFKKYYPDKIKEAENIALKIINYADEENNNRALAYGYKNMGLINYTKFDFIKAVEYFQKSLDIFNLTDNDLEIANVYNNIGVVFEHIGQLNEALQNYLQAYNIYNEIKDNKGVSRISNNIGSIHYLLGNYNKAKNYFDYSYEFKKQLSDTIGMIQVLSNLANIFFYLNNSDSALLLYRKVIRLERTNPIYQKNICKSYNNLGEVFLNMNFPDSAKYFFKMALGKAKNTQNMTILSRVYDNIGLIEFGKKNYKRAIRYYDSSLAVSSAFMLTENEKDTYLNLSNVYAEETNFKKAFEHYKEYEKLKTRSLLEKNKANVTEALYVNQKNENYILRLEKDSEKKQKQFIVLSSVMIIILIIGIFFYKWHGLIQRNKIKEQISELEKFRFKAVIEAQEDERRRIAGDLHDSLGQMLSVAKMYLSDLNIQKNEKNTNLENLSKSIKIIDEACEEVRNISHNLMPGSLTKIGLIAAIKELVRKINETKKLEIKLYNEIELNRFDEKIEIAVYRIIQELINNSIKHSDASKMEIDITINLDLLNINVKDNGRGFNIKLIEKSKGIGWKNIYSRLNMVNGNISIIASPDEGVVYKIAVPI